MIEPTLAGPYPKPRASGKEKAAIATIPIRYKKALKNAQIATRSNKSGLFTVLTSEHKGTACTVDLPL